METNGPKLENETSTWSYYTPKFLKWHKHSYLKTNELYY